VLSRLLLHAQHTAELLRLRFRILWQNEKSMNKKKSG
jgi:hypothetical protein